MPRKARDYRVAPLHVSTDDILRIVADAAIAHPGIGDGHLIPLVILDISNRPDLEEHIRLHQHTDAGDVSSQWARPIDNESMVVLNLTFVRPTELAVVIGFDLDRGHGILIDHVLASRGLYLQAGREGDRLKHDIDKPKIILEIPSSVFSKDWDDIYLRALTAQIKAKGMKRGEARHAAKRFIAELRQATSRRVQTLPK